MSQTNKLFRVWLLLDSRDFGGIESHVEQLALGLQNNSTQPTTEVCVVFWQHYDQHPCHERLDKQGIHYFALDGTLGSLWQQIKQQQPDVIHTHGYKAGILARPVCFLLNVRCVSTFHSGEAKQGMLKLYDIIDRYSAFLAQRVYAVSPAIQKSLPCRAEIADNFINFAHTSSSNGQQIAFVGRLSHEKAPDRLLSLAKRFPNTDFHVYGDGPMKEQLMKKATANVVFHGAQSDMSVIWPKISLLLMPSRAEGLPMAALEAMSHGIPVIATNVGALAQLISPSNNGWLVSTGEIEEYAQALRQWQAFSFAEQAQMKQCAIDTIQRRFSAQHVIPKLLLSYQRN